MVSGNKDNLDISKYPDIVRKYLEKERELLLDFIRGSVRVLDVGCGTGRIIQELSPIVKEYVGIDIDKGYLESARKIAEGFRNVKILELDVMKLSEKFGPGYFDKSFLLFNTLGSLKNDKAALVEISRVTKNRCFLSLVARGSLEQRKTYYEKMNIDYDFDEKAETIYSSQWGMVRAYSEEEIREFVDGTDFIIDDIRKVYGQEYLITLAKKR